MTPARQELQSEHKHDIRQIIRRSEERVREFLEEYNKPQQAQREPESKTARRPVKPIRKSQS